MNRVVGTDQQLCSRPHDLRRRLEHTFTDRIPAGSVYQMLVSAKREAVQADLRMIMRSENCRAFKTNRPVTKRGALGANCNNPDVFHNSVPFRPQTTKLKVPL